MGDDFIRAHRNALISTLFLTGIEKVGNDLWQVYFDSFDEKPELSRRQKPVIRNWLRNQKKI